MKKNIIKQKGRMAAAALILLSCLTACGNRVTGDNMSKEEAIGALEAETEDSGDIASAEDSESAALTEEGNRTEGIQTDRDSMIDAYVSILEGVYGNHSFPDGYDYGFDDYYDISENQFAVYDIDRDGKEELIIQYVTTASAGMIEKIYDFNSSTNTVTEEFSEFPNLTYYDNGVIEAGWSHNQGLAGEFWPYTLYRYDRESDTYVEEEMVDAWDKSLSETNYDGEPFPEDADKDGDGIVYYIMPDGKYELNAPADSEEYNQWHDSYVKGAEKVAVPYRNLSEENINSIK